jgi:hypothetical protein
MLQRLTGHPDSVRLRGLDHELTLVDGLGHEGRFDAEGAKRGLQLADR